MFVQQQRTMQIVTLAWIVADLLPTRMSQSRRQELKGERLSHKISCCQRQYPSPSSPLSRIRLSKILGSNCRLSSCVRFSRSPSWPSRLTRKALSSLLSYLVISRPYKTSTQTIKWVEQGRTKWMHLSMSTRLSKVKYRWLKRGQIRPSWAWVSAIAQTQTWQITYQRIISRALVKTTIPFRARTWRRTKTEIFSLT